MPAGVRAAVDRRLGSPVVRAVTARGGFSPGVASRLLTADGLRVFARDGGVARALSPSSAARRMGSTYSASRAIVPTARTMSKACSMVKSARAWWAACAGGEQGPTGGQHPVAATAEDGV